MKKRVVVVCPGRGSYTAETLGYLRRHPVAKKNPEFIREMDLRRRQVGEPTLTELDNKEKFAPTLHTRGEHASALIYACSALDFMSINREEYEVVAVCGNSMGWYLALAMAGVLDPGAAFHVVQTMGSMMKTEIIGGQVIYPIVDDTWARDLAKEEALYSALEEIQRKKIGEAYISIWLGGYIVVGGDKAGLQYLLKALPKSGDYPFQLINNAAFHTPMLFETSRRAMEFISPQLFQRPNLPLVDGRGEIWQPYATDLELLYNYTLAHQVYAPFDFTATLTVALKEFAPDYLWLLGPGASLGGAIGQILVKNKWRGITDKNIFKSRSTEVLKTFT